MLLALALAVALAPPQAGPDPERYDVVWTTPSADANGSMPLGNGELAANAWIEADGTLSFYLASTDAWGEHGRLLKVGRVHVALDPPLAPSAAFEQRLSLGDGTLRAHLADDTATCDLELWIDANLPLVEVELACDPPRAAVLRLDPWRTERVAYPAGEVSDLWEDRAAPNHLRRELFVEPDVLVAAEPLAAAGLAAAVGWYHHAPETGVVLELARRQGLGPWFEGRPDPLAPRTFGGVAISEGPATRVDAATLRAEPAARQRFTLLVTCEHPAQPAEWVARAATLAARAARSDVARRRQEHVAWWRAFAARSWIHVRSTRRREVLPANEHPLRVGEDQAGGNRLDARLERVLVTRRALAPEELARHARFGLASTEVGSACLALLAPEPGVVPDAPELDASEGLTLEAWLAPGGAGRLLDRITPGGSDGWLLDAYPRGGLRCIVGTTTVQAPGALEVDAGDDGLLHVAAVLDPARERLALFVAGREVAWAPLPVADEGLLVSRAYALQRYVTACAGRGRYPIKFNGSLFTVPAAGRFGDADYRRWGPGYWWQNTRLPYLGLATSGDLELADPLFRMYAQELLGVHMVRAVAQAGHGGLLMPECLYFFGPAFAATYGWTPLAERGADKLQESGWHKREWVGQLELAWMMLDAYAHSEDAGFARGTLAPFAREALRFFDEQWALGPDGRYVMEPAQALETWWDCTGPAPEIAGLQAVTEALLRLDREVVGEDLLALARRVHARTPELPTVDVEGELRLAPAWRFADKRNVENPELYPVFPFRRVTFATPERALGLAAYAARADRGTSGWRQDVLFAAVLGLAEDARAQLVARAAAHDPGQRFPAFWGPNYDWTPDQDHGGVLVRALQQMLLQTDGERIWLLPAWPREWDVDFRLHAPGRTVLEGSVRGGELRALAVDPPERRADVVVR